MLHYPLTETRPWYLRWRPARCACGARSWARCIDQRAGVAGNATQIRGWSR